jgi:hypothetical protein
VQKESGTKDAYGLHVSGFPGIFLVFPDLDRRAGNLFQREWGPQKKEYAEIRQRRIKKPKSEFASA